MQSVYLTWMISALALGVLLLPVYKPKWSKLSLPPFVDFFRRYWVHILIVFAIYNAKDGLDQIDRLLMASTGLDDAVHLGHRRQSGPVGSTDLRSRLAHHSTYAFLRGWVHVHLLCFRVLFCLL